MNKKWLEYSGAVCGLVLGLAMALEAADYTIDTAHSSVGFSIRHLVSKTHGQFGEFEGTFSFDPAKPEASEVQAIIKTISIHTNNEKRDGHLRSADFFNVDKFPTMVFIGKKMKRGAAKDTYRLEGTLTLLGVSKPVMLEVTLNGTANDPWGNIRSGFEAKGTVNRKDFGMVWNKTLDTGGLMLGEDVAIDIAVEGIQKK